MSIIKKSIISIVEYFIKDNKGLCKMCNKKLSEHDIQNESMFCSSDCYIKYGNGRI